MKRSALALALILALLLSAVVGGLFVDVGKANFTPLPELPPPIYIRSDGSVEPSSAFVQQVGDTYTFTDDIDNSIEVQRDNIVIDGNGFSVTQTPVNTSGLMIPAGWYPAIRLTDRRNVTAKNVKIHDCISGITIESSTNITLTNNSITGIAKIAIFSASSSNCTISRNDITNNDQGILIIDSTYINIFENNITRNSIGISCYAYTYPPNDAGVTSGCAYINMFGNNIIGNAKNGISLMGSFYNRIAYNTIANNNNGIRPFPSYHTIIYHNNFISNFQNVDTAYSAYAGGGYTWIWDSGSEGNYWSDYITKYRNATEIAHSGVGNTPYVIDVNNIDHYPLMSPVSTQPPYTILEFPLPSPTPTPTPSPSSTPTPSPSPSPSEQPTKTTGPQPNPFPTWILASVVSLAIVGIGLLIYFRKRNSSG
jgi:parallel beta-helix repeat protein